MRLQALVAFAWCRRFEDCPPRDTPFSTILHNQKASAFRPGIGQGSALDHGLFIRQHIACSVYTVAGHRKFDPGRVCPRLSAKASAANLHHHQTADAFIECYCRSYDSNGLFEAEVLPMWPE